MPGEEEDLDGWRPPLPAPHGVSVVLFPVLHVFSLSGQCLDENGFLLL